MFNIKEYKEGMEIETNDILQAKDGLFRAIDNKLYTGIVKIEEFRNFDKLKPKLSRIKLPKFPYETLKKIHVFFKSIYKEHRAEVAVLLWHNFEEKTWDVEVPQQIVSGASVDYTRDEDEAKGLEAMNYVCVGSIHSHCEMGAFHSGTDDADEYGFDGLHITIGKVMSGPEFACRFIFKNHAVKLELNDCVDMPETIEEEVPESWLEKVKKYVWQQSNKKKGNKKGKCNKNKAEIPKWMKNAQDQGKIMTEKFNPKAYLTDGDYTDEQLEEMGYDVDYVDVNEDESTSTEKQQLEDAVMDGYSQFEKNE